MVVCSEGRQVQTAALCHIYARRVASTVALRMAEPMRRWPSLDVAWCRARMRAGRPPAGKSC